MGITIHYTLITEDCQTVLMAVNAVRESARKMGYDVREVCEEVHISFSKSALPRQWRDSEKTREYLEDVWRGYREGALEEVPEEPPFAWIAVDYPEPGWYTYATPWILGKAGKPSRLEGVMAAVDTAEPFTVAFYKLGRYYICDDFTKTQAFTVDEVGPNTEYHKWICHTLKLLERSGRWWSFRVLDEAEYYDTLDESKIVEGFEAVSKMLYTLTAAMDKLAEEHGFSVSVGGGKVDVRRLRKKYEEAERGAASQATLDEYFNDRLGGGEV